jgi:hypothetical protein
MRKMKKFLTAAALTAALAVGAPMAQADVPGAGVTIGGAVNGDLAWQILGEDNIISNNSGASLTNFFAAVSSDSYLRAVFTSPDKTTGAHIELGVYAGTNAGNEGGASDESAKLRYAYGWWQTGICKLTVGQADSRLGDGGTSATLGDMKSGKGGFTGFGFVGATRGPRILLDVEASDNVALQFSLGQAGSETSVNPLYDSGYDPTDTDAKAPDKWSSTDSYLPRLEAIVDFTLGDFAFGLGGGISYQSWKGDDAKLKGVDYDDNVLAYLLWAPIEYSSGRFAGALNLHYGQNVETDWTGKNTSAYEGFISASSANGIYGGQPGSLPLFSNAGKTLEDTTQWGIGLDLNFALTEKLTLALGGGLTLLATDAWGDTEGSDDKYTRWGAYVGLPYSLSDNFTLQPEIAYYNYGDRVGANYSADADEEAGDEWLLGVHFSIVF